MKRVVRGWGLAASIVLALAGCGGGGGGDGTVEVPTTPTTPTGPGVAVPTGTSPITLTANTPAATFAALQPKVTVGRVTIANAAPVVDFSITDQDGNAVIGFGSTSKSATATVASYPNLAFSLAKLVPGAGGAPSKWVSYIVTTVPTQNATTGVVTPAAPTRPSTDNTGTLVDHGNGTYTYTFFRDVTKVKDQVAGMTVAAPNNTADLGDLTYDQNLTHRLTIQVSGNAPGTGTNTPTGVSTTAGVPMRSPVDAIFDFVPATGAAVASTDSGRDIVATAKCNECHRVLGGIPGGNEESQAAGFHGGSRNETRYCVVCHTDQRKYGRPEATVNATTLAVSGSSAYRMDGRAFGDLPNYIHKTHAGPLLQKKGYDYAGVKFNEVHFPQDIRNCTKCHDGSDTSTAKTTQGDNWKNVPSRVACGSCHDGINFETGRGVTMADALGGAVTTTSFSGFAHGARQGFTDDTRCSTCHDSSSIDIVHLPVTPPNTASALHVAGGSANTNAAWIASNTSRLPPGAIKVTYELKSLALNASRQPVFQFRLLQNGNRADLNDPATKTEIWDNFMGSPSLQVVYAVPQDGIAEPSDFNASGNGYIRTLWKAGALGAPDADGFYTATLTNVTVPETARMLTGGIGFSYNVVSTLPLTQTNVPGYPISAATSTALTDAQRAALPPAPMGGLIVIVPNVTKVATGFTGRRPIVEDARCNACHQELGTFTEEAFHGGQRNDGTTCSWCHTPNRASSGWTADSTNFVHAIHASAKRTVPYTWHATGPTLADTFDAIHYPGILADCQTCHLPGTYELTADTTKKLYRTVATGTFAPADATATLALSPYVTPGVNYGTGFNAGTGAAAAGTTLVLSPTASACFACHDSNLARAHIEGNGGSIYAPRSTALAKPELCELCHAPGKVADVKVMHAR